MGLQRFMNRGCLSVALVVGSERETMLNEECSACASVGGKGRYESRQSKIRGGTVKRWRI